MMPDSTENLHIVAYDPKKVLLRRIAIILLFIVGVLGAFVYGKWYSGYSSSSSVEERDELLILTKQQNKELIELRKSLATANSGLEIDKKSNKDLQQTVKELNARLAQAENEVAFYKRVMKPVEGEQRLRLQTWEVKPTATKGTYNFELVISQNSQTNNRMEGRALVNIIGKKGTTKMALPIKDVSPQISESSIKFGFKFYQRVEGQIILPKDFVAEKVEIILQSTGANAMRLENTFDWPKG